MKNSTRIILIITFLYNLQFTVLAQSWILPKDGKGWSILNPSTDSRIIYVSESAGNDASGQIYSISQIGSDPRNPSITVNAYKSIDAGLNQMRNGYPDWLLLKRGDEWNDEEIPLRHRGSGRSQNERSVITYYGVEGSRPMLKNGTVSAIGGIFNQYWAIVGLCFYASKADPNSTDYDNTTTHTTAMTHLSGGNYILYEDCRLWFNELVIQVFDSTYNNIEIRRNIISDVYYTNNCSDNSIRPCGVYFSGITNYLIEENMVDHCGWNEDLLPGAGRNMYNHGFYLQYDNSGELIFRGNIMSRSSANGVQNRSGGMVEKNLSIQNPIGIYVGHDTTHGPGANPGITCAKYNVILEGVYMGNCATSSGANWGLDLSGGLENATTIEENIVAHNIDPRGSVSGINRNAQCTYTNNIVYDWVNSENMWNPDWPAPERSVGSYNASISGASTTETFIESARNRGVHQWPEELSAYSVINYIREGFGLGQITTSVGKQIQKPVEFKLYQNFPNPFNPSTKITFSVETYNYTSLRIYDILGREIITLINGMQSAGEHTVEWNGKNLAGQKVGSGVYFYQLSVVPLTQQDLAPTESRDGKTSNGFVSTKKMMLLK